MKENPPTGRRLVLVSVVVVLAIVGLGAVGLFAYLRKGDVDDQVSAVPAVGTVMGSDAVVEVSSCTTDEVGDPVATGSLTNHSDSRSGYLLSVAFEHDDTRFDLVVAQLDHVEPGARAEWTATSFVDSEDSFGCVVDRVEQAEPASP